MKKLIAVLITAMMAGLAVSAEAASTCTDCHGMPPVDAPYRNISTGGFKGSHQTHNPATAPVSSCTPCHPGAASYSTGHLSGAINLATNINASPVAATYSKGVFFNQTSNPVMGTCSNVNCHFESVSPAWASTKLAVPGGCTACHGAPPADGNHPGITGAGKKHADYYGTGTGSCKQCHPDHAVEAAPFAHASSAGNRGLIVGFSGGGTYSGNVAYPNYLPSKTPARNGTCSGLYCHSDGKGRAPLTAAVWGVTYPTDCTGCHGGNGTSFRPMTSSGHRSHVGKGVQGFACGSCHTSTLAAANDRAITSIPNHVNRTLEVAFTGGGTWSPTARTCSNTTCHGTAAPNWSAKLPTDCTGCHGGTASSSRPMASAAHPTHLTAANGPGTFLGGTVDSCRACHDYATTQPDAKHSNGTVNVLSAAGSACAKCHPGTIPAWTATSVSCESCHVTAASVLPNGVAAPLQPNFTTTGHGQAAPNYDSSRNCGSCHDANSAHISGVLGDAKRLYNTANDNTLCNGCHSSSFVVPTATKQNVPSHVTSKGSGPTSDCKTCHDPHGTTNLYMINTSIAGKTIVFKNLSTAFVKTVAPYDGLCQVCHYNTTHFRAGVAMDGHPTKNCLQCHPHKGTYAFQAQAGCSACHGYPPAPAGFKGIHNNYTSGRAEDYTGGSGAHLIAAHVKPTAVPSEGWANCTMCHGNGSMNPTTHTMALPVTPSKITVDVADRYKFNSSLPLTNKQYNGVMVDTGANATGSCFNVRCHFKPSKRWSTVK